MGTGASNTSIVYVTVLCFVCLHGVCDCRRLEPGDPELQTHLFPFWPLIA